MKDDYCQRTKDWLAAMGFKNLAEVRGKLIELEEKVNKLKENQSYLTGDAYLDKQDLQ